MKLSPIQQKIINHLKDDNCFILKSLYFNHNKVIERFIGDYKPEYQIMQFTRATFDALFRVGLIEQQGDNKNFYVLV